MLLDGSSCFSGRLEHLDNVQLKMVDRKKYRDEV